MTSYLVYSTVALKWNRKIHCGNSCRRINLPLCLVWERRSLPASNNFWTKVQLSTKSDAFIDQYSAVSNNLLSTCCIVFLKMRYHDIVAFRTKIEWMRIWSLTLQTSRFALWHGKNIVWSFSMPLWCNKHLPGQSASIIIAFEFFGKFVSSRNPSIFWAGGKVCACFWKNVPFSRLSRYFLRSNDFGNQQHFVLKILWLIVCHWWAGIYVNKFRHFG